VTEPPSGAHVEVMVAGTAAALGLPGNTLGIAPLANDCSSQPSAIAYAFANAHLSGPDLVAELCATTAHEAGHIYGLDHEFECKDPMTYLTGCGIKVFLNRTVACGEFDAPRSCKCGERQSSHRKLYDVLGPGAPPGPPPIAIRSPMPGATVNPTFSVFVDVDGRPATTVELWINGAQFGALPGKLSDSPYELVTPASLFDGVLDLEVRVYDDLGTLGTATLTVQKGAPCVNADACPAGFTCDAGRCLAPPGEAQVGDDCTSQGECASKECVSRGGESICTEPCWQAIGTCPGGLTCLQADDERFACFVPDEGGCCSAGGDPRAPLALVGLVGLALARRRRRRVH
jgi:MYXO-CTERM domain-containing protein